MRHFPLFGFCLALLFLSACMGTATDTGNTIATETSSSSLSTTSIVKSTVVATYDTIKSGSSSSSTLLQTNSSNAQQSSALQLSSSSGTTTAYSCSFYAGSNHTDSNINIIRLSKFQWNGTILNKNQEPWSNCIIKASLGSYTDLTFSPAIDTTDEFGSFSLFVAAKSPQNIEVHCQDSTGSYSSYLYNVDIDQGITLYWTKEP